MINPQELVKTFVNAGVTLFTGVPDSLLREWIRCLSREVNPKQHVITASEGGAVALASGHFLGGGGVAVVYMQNSGLGNAINPLLSLADEKVYALPMILLIGWRGCPHGPKDEPQHIKQGLVTTKLLEAIQIDYKIIDPNTLSPIDIIKSTLQQALNGQCPKAIIIEPKVFSTYQGEERVIDYDSPRQISRKKAIEIITDEIATSAAFVATTGFTSRELFTVREEKKEVHHLDFLNVGAMGHCSLVALGISRIRNKQNIICLDGDGSMLMHLGGAAIIGSVGSKNFCHVLFNNGVHESVGGQPTGNNTVNYSELAKSLGYRVLPQQSEEQGIRDAFKTIPWTRGPIFIEIKVGRRNKEELLGRPPSNLRGFRDKFMQGINGS